MKRLLLLLSFLITYTGHISAQSIPLHWLGEKAPTRTSGQSWGVPFPKGKVKSNQSFSLTDSEGKAFPLQSWKLATWPDGSLKWIGFATVSDNAKGDLKLTLSSTKATPTTTIQATENVRNILINNGKITCQIPKQGSAFLDSLKINGQLVGVQGELVCIRQNTFESDVYESSTKEKFTSEVQKVTVEQKGNVRAVVKIEGKFKTVQRSWLPFIVRLYFYANTADIRLVHTIIYDGDQQKDFIKGLGLVLNVPMREEILNRHVRFGGEETGIWSEPVQPLTGRRSLMHEGKNVYENQIVGKRVPNKTAYDPKQQYLVKDWAAWADFRLIQHSADGFTIQKRTHAQGAWIDSQGGKRASGVAFVGDVSGGISVSVKDFWQAHPAALEIKNATSDKAELRAWLWSPYGEAMDMRHYDTLATGHGLEASYEDVQPGFSIAQGMARTSEMTLSLYENVPSNEHLSQLSQHPLLACTPQYLHDAGAFGTWSLPNRSTENKRWLEDQLDKAITFYQKEIEQRHWYGFWNYGDVMHGYDPIRHSWRYDIGGFAWANTELAPDMWLWYSFLRTGRADIFQMAEAMTRHTSEVDVYHLGRFAGLGSRHNVRHWGCGSKEVRISQAALKRFYYYLTTDERTGDLMQEVANADEALVNTDPLRLILPKSQYPTHARVGPDWIALVGNWMTEWERTGDTRWRDKILTGVNSFAKMPYGFFSGKEGAFGYDPKDSKMYQLAAEDIGNSHLASIMGSAEVAFELSKMLENPTFDKLWLQYCQLYGASKEEVKQAFGKEAKLGDLSPHYARLPAYVSKMTNNPTLAQKAWDEFLKIKNRPFYGTFDWTTIFTPTVLKPIDEIPYVSTNNTAQWCLNAIELLELVGDKMPEKHPLWSEKK